MGALPQISDLQMMCCVCMCCVRSCIGLVQRFFFCPSGLCGELDWRHRSMTEGVFEDSHAEQAVNHVVTKILQKQ